MLSCVVYLYNEAMKKRCFLHLGLHKTASSSAQATFRSSKNILRECNIEFPIFKYIQPNSQIKRISNHSIPILSLFSDNPSQYHINKRWGVTDIDDTNASYLKQLISTVDSGRDILLSGEDISTLSAAGIRQFTSLINDLGFIIYAFALVRTPYSFACSAMQTKVKGGTYIAWLDDSMECNNIKATLILPARSGILSNLLDHFGDSLKLMSFSEALLHQYGPVGYIVDHMQMCKSSDLTYVRKNRSMGNKWIRAKNVSNGYFKGETLVIARNAKGLKPSTVFTNDSKKFLLTEQEFQNIESELVSESNAMRKLMGSTFVDDEYEFTDPLTAQDWQLIYLETLASL